MAGESDNGDICGSSSARRNDFLGFREAVFNDSGIDVGGDVGDFALAKK